LPNTPSPGRNPGAPPVAQYPGRPLRIAFWVLLAAVGILRILAAVTENVNWDEFALFQRAELLARTGILQGGGRPGLVNVALAPVAAHCVDTVQALVQARHAWTLLVFGSVAAFALLLRAALPPSPHRWVAVATAVGLWTLSPDLLRYSVHVRTDQPAILFGLLGGLALAARPATRRWALAAGACFALGFLASQKLVYVAALAGLLALVARVQDPEVAWGRELQRVAIVGVTFLALILAYRYVSTSVGAGAPSLAPLPGIRRVFAYYREEVGFRHYHAMAFRNAHVIYAAAVVAAFSAYRLRRGIRREPLVAGALAILALGVFVVGFHAARFPYFYLVLGLFPAAAVALAMGPLLTALGPRPSRKGLFLIPIWVAMLGVGAVGAIDPVRTDAQATQRDTLRFVATNFEASERGFAPFGEFGCRGDPDPFPARFFQSVYFTFVVADGTETVEQMIEAFRTRPVAFMLEPPGHHPYPFELLHFWETRYVRYHGQVRIPGRQLRGGPDWTDTFEVLVPGQYRWIPEAGRDELLLVDGERVAPGELIELPDVGFVTLELPEGGIGMLARAVADPPDLHDEPFFRAY
jgi:hypothetical protein